MTAFGDELRKVIAKKADELHVAEFYRRREASERQRKRDELHAAAAGLVRDVFRPLVSDFRAALEAAGIFGCDSQLFVGRTRKGAYVCSCRAAAARGGRGYRVRFLAKATAEGRIELKSECKAGSTEQGARSKKSQASGSWQECFDAAAADSPPPAPRSLLSIAGKSVSFETAKMQNPSVELWCRDALKKIAAACMEAERGGERQRSEG